MYPQLGLHIDSELEFRVIFGPREGRTARGAALGARTQKKNQVARCERGVDALRCASVCVSLGCVSVCLPVERRGNDQRRGQGTLTPAILMAAKKSICLNNRAFYMSDKGEDLSDWPFAQSPLCELT